MLPMIGTDTIAFYRASYKRPLDDLHIAAIGMAFQKF